MRRCEFLLAAGGVATLGGLAAADRDADAVAVRWWATRRAVGHGGLRERVTGYLERAFADGDGVAVTCGGVVDTTTEDANRAAVDGEWPRLLLAAAGSRRGPVAGVNLLVTDGSMLRVPTGAGLPGVAAGGGARYLARLPPADAVPGVVSDDLRMRTAQIVLHEVGHGLGLRHDHGTIRADDAAAVVSPMVSGYAWGAGPVGATFDYERDRCGRRYPSVVGREPRLMLSFDDCARRAVRRYRRLAAPASFPESPVGTAAVVRRACPGLACGRWGDATAGGPDAPADGSDRDAPGGARPGCRAEAPSGA